MSKFYRITAFIIILINVTSVKAQVIKEYQVTNLQPDMAGNISHIQEQDVDILIKADLYTTATAEFLMPCLSMAGSFPFIGLESGGTLDIINQGQAQIYSIQYVARSSNSYTRSESASAVSTDGTSFPGDVYLNGTGFPKRLTKSLYLSGDNQDVCDMAYVHFIPDTVYLGAEKTRQTDFRKQVSRIRLIWGVESFAGINMTPGAQPEIYGLRIRVVTNEDPVGINTGIQRKETSLKSIAKNVYAVDEKARVTLYEVSGRKVMQIKDQTHIDINYLPRGMYIIKAQTQEEEKPMVYKVIKQ